MPETYAQDWWLIQRFGKQRYLLVSLVAILVLLPLLSSQETSRFWTVMILTLIMVTGPLVLATRRFDFYFTLLLGVLIFKQFIFSNDGVTEETLFAAVNAYVYLSFVTITTLGYGDITPQSELAAILTYSEAVVGQFFMALVVASIVGIWVADKQR